MQKYKLEDLFFGDEFLNIDCYGNKEVGSRNDVYT